jgi:heme exporter protein C
MGHVQRIFYIHVPSAWIAFLAFGLVFLGSIQYLRTREQKWDNFASASAELGVIFTTLVLVTGPIWAKPVWGIWWTWDVRLTTTLVLWLIYVSYLMVRSYSDNHYQASRYSAVLGIIGVINLPLVYFAVNWWNTQHQRLVLGIGSTEAGLDPDMRTTLYFSLLAFSSLFVWLLWFRVFLKKTEDMVRENTRLGTDQ